LIFERERERLPVLHTGYQVMFEKRERERLSVLNTGYQMIFETLSFKDQLVTSIQNRNSPSLSLSNIIW
jgi:hypothetical protein